MQQTLRDKSKVEEKEGQAHKRLSTIVCEHTARVEEDKQLKASSSRGSNKMGDNMSFQSPASSCRGGITKRPQMTFGAEQDLLLSYNQA